MPDRPRTCVPSPPHLRAKRPPKERPAPRTCVPDPRACALNGPKGADPIEGGHARERLYRYTANGDPTSFETGAPPNVYQPLSAGAKENAKGKPMFGPPPRPRVVVPHLGGVDFVPPRTRIGSRINRETWENLRPPSCAGRYLREGTHRHRLTEYSQQAQQPRRETLGCRRR